MTRVAIASSSQIAADAGAEVADAGGNAVDTAIAMINPTFLILLVLLLFSLLLHIINYYYK